MRLSLYLFCDGLVLCAYLLMAQAALMRRMLCPMTYAAICAAACGATFIGVVSDACRRFLAAYGLPLLIAAFALFFAVEMARLADGLMRRQELVCASALLFGTLLSLVGGMELRGLPRLAFQTAAVAVPIAVALAAIGARPVPEMTPQPAIYAHTLAPVPEQAR